MKTFRLFLCVMSLLLPPAASAQKRINTEPEPNPSISEMFERLESSDLFAAARVGLTDNVWRHRNGTGLYDEPTLETEKEVFSQGFRFDNIKGCTLTLKNDDVRMLLSPEQERSRALTYAGGGPPPRYVAELQIQLDRLSARKGKSALRVNRNPDKARLYGAWRAEYRFEGNVAKSPVFVSMFPAGLRESRKKYEGESVGFTFDSREQSLRFDAVFRRAIKLCESH
jgi:hypothetical protein